MTNDFYWVNDNTRDFMNKDYLQGNQTPEGRVGDIAEAAGAYYKKTFPNFAEKFYRYMAKGFYSLSSPVWANFGTTRGLPISCNGSYIPDSIEGMYEKLGEVGVMTKHGAGTSFYVGDVRRRGAAIKSGGVADGPVHYLQLFESALNITSQGQVRRGNGAAYLDIDHPDFLEFLHIQEVGDPIQKLSIGACVSDDFLASLRTNPDNANRWLKLIEKRFASGFPYVFFTDNVNNQKPQWYKDKGYHIYSSNLCVAGNTRVLTKTGYEEIYSLVGKDKEVWNGEEWSLAHFEQTGENRPLYRVTTSDGSVLDCTAEHDWYVVPGYGKAPEKVKTKNLKTGDLLEKFNLGVVDHGLKEFPRAYTNGFFSGDGCQNKGASIIYLYGDKSKLLDKMEGDITWSEGDARFVGRTKGLQKFVVPNSSFSVKSRLNWLAGYLDADGTVVSTAGCQQLQMVSVESDFLESVRLMLQELGIYSRKTKVRDEGIYDLPTNDGTGGCKGYKCQTIYRLTMSAVDTRKLLDLGLECYRLKLDKRDHQRDAAKFNTIVSVEPLEGLHNTYCFNEPKRHKGMFNGVLTGQCSEIALPLSERESFVCNLSSMNLAKYDEWKGTDAVMILTLFLDAVMEEYIQKTEGVRFMEAANRFAKNHRAIGIGTLGLHTHLLDKGETFGGFYSRAFNKAVHKQIKEQSYEASRHLAELLGEPEVTKGYGMRNATTMAIAPTTSSSFILGQVSPSIEPLAANIFTKNLSKGSYVFKTPQLEALLEDRGMNTTEVWSDISMNAGSVQHLTGLNDEEKAVFRTFDEVSQMDIITMAAERQPFIDQSQSVNLKIPSDAKLSEVNKLLLTAHKMGVKSLYYQRGTNAAKELARRDLLACTSCES